MRTPARLIASVGVPNNLRMPPDTDINNALAISYAKAEQKVGAAAKKKKDPAIDAKLLTKFKGDYPPSLLAIMSGQPSADGMGFHQIAMQIGITTNALGKREDQMLVLCEGLIQNHISDGARYNSPGKRKAELQRMFRYTQDNVCYSYSKDAVRRLVPDDVLTLNYGIFAKERGGDREGPSQARAK